LGGNAVHCSGRVPAAQTRDDQSLAVSKRGASVAPQVISSFVLGSFGISDLQFPAENAGMERSVCASHLQKASENVTVEICQRRSRVQNGARVSAERFRGDTGGSLVFADHPRHDAEGLPTYKEFLDFLRGNRYKHFGGSPAEN